MWLSGKSAVFHSFAKKWHILKTHTFFERCAKIRFIGRKSAYKKMNLILALDCIYVPLFGPGTVLRNFTKIWLILAFWLFWQFGLFGRKTKTPKVFEHSSKMDFQKNSESFCRIPKVLSPKVFEPHCTLSSEKKKLIN